MELRTCTFLPQRLAQLAVESSNLNQMLRVQVWGSGIRHVDIIARWKTVQENTETQPQMYFT